MQILRYIPNWVFLLLIALIGLGLLQTRTRQVQKRRLLVTSVALTAVTLAGVIQLWRNTPWLEVSLLSWGITSVGLSWALSQAPAPAKAGYDALTRRFTVPGSWWPLSIFMAIFACKFTVGFLNATAPQTLKHLTAAVGISVLYGLCSGVLNARSWHLLKLEKAS